MDRGAGRVTRSKWCVKWDTSARQENGRSEVNNLISIWNVASHADETEIMGGDCSVSNNGSIRLWDVVFYLEKQ